MFVALFLLNIKTTTICSSMSSIFMGADLPNLRPFNKKDNKKLSKIILNGRFFY